MGKATISVMSVRLSVRMKKKLAPHWMDFNEIWYLNIFFKNLSRKSKLHYNLTILTGTLNEDEYAFFIIFRSVPLIMSNVSGQDIKKTKMYFIFKRFFSIIVLYVILWKNITEPESPQTSMWCMCIACWIPKASNTEYVIILNFSLQQRLHELASMIPYAYIVCLVLYISVPHHPGSQSWLYSIINLLASEFYI